MAGKGKSKLGATKSKGKVSSDNNGALSSQPPMTLFYFIALVGVILAASWTYFNTLKNDTVKNSSSMMSSTGSFGDSIDPQVEYIPSSKQKKAKCAADDEVCQSEAAAATSVDAEIPKWANTQGKPREAIKECVDRYPKECKDFAKAGQCVDFPGWNTINCPKSCGFCHLRDPTIRCSFEALNVSADPIFPDGQLTAMLASIPERFGHLYDINVLSTDPWVLTFENFVSDQEIEELISAVKKWERSTDSGSLNEYGEQGRILSTGRTSSNAWCDAECESKPHVKSLYKKIEDVTLVPFTNYESFQILRYEIGQHYSLHHDMSVDDNNLMCGPRILTMFLYLSDVDEGGETSFPHLNIAVKPKKGRALLWPSVLDQNGLRDQDGRTHHQAMPVVKGLKFAANAWLHARDYAVANKWGCTGSFADLVCLLCDWLKRFIVFVLE